MWINFPKNKLGILMSLFPNRLVKHCCLTKWKNQQKLSPLYYINSQKKSTYGITESRTPS